MGNSCCYLRVTRAAASLSPERRGKSRDARARSSRTTGSSPPRSRSGCAARGWPSTSPSTARRRSVACRGESYDVIVLDRDLPKIHGDEVCRTLVERGPRSRVLMLTASDTVEHRVDGLSLGADDYLAKPFAFAELVARIRALARRSPARAAADARARRHPPRHGAARSRAAPAADSSSARRSSPCSSCCSRPTAPRSRPSSSRPGLGRVRRPFANVVKVTISRLRRKLGEPPAIETVARAATGSPCERAQAASPRRWLRRLPARTIRLRLTLLYGGLFLVSGAALLARHLPARRATSTPNGAASSSAPATPGRGQRRPDQRRRRGPRTVRHRLGHGTWRCRRAPVRLEAHWRSARYQSTPR